MAVIVWQLNLHLPMESVPITTDVVSSNLDLCATQTLVIDGIDVVGTRFNFG